MFHKWPQFKTPILIEYDNPNKCSTFYKILELKKKVNLNFKDIVVLKVIPNVIFMNL